jgi:hypothetical protein
MTFPIGDEGAPRRDIGWHVITLDGPATLS